MKNFGEKVSSEVWFRIKGELRAIRDTRDFQTGMMLAQELVANYRDDHPSLVKCFEEDPEDSLNHLKLPFIHRQYVRTTNLIERSFEEERRRTKVIPGFATEKSTLKLVFSVLIRAAKRWQKVTFTRTEIAQLDRLREELGIMDIETEAAGEVG